MTYRFRRLQCAAAITILALSGQIWACTPPTPEEVARWPSWSERIASVYEQSETVFVAKVVRESCMDNPPSCRSFLEPIRFFKGNASLAPSYIDKTGNTCDKRPFAPEGSKVLVFASVYQGKAVELLRVTPQEDKTASGALTLQYTSAMRQVEALSRTKKP